MDDATADSAATAPSTSCELWSCDVSGVVLTSNQDSPDANSTSMNKKLGVPHVTCMSWSPDTSMAAFGTPEGAVTLVKTSDGSSWTVVHTFYDHAKPVTALAWCATTFKLATASNDATVRGGFFLES